MKRSSDYSIAIGAGIATGLLTLPLLKNIDVQFPYEAPHIVLVVLLPIVWVVGIGLGRFLSRWFPFFGQFSRYAVAGFLSAGIDFGVLNSLIFLTGISAGIGFGVFKGAGYILGNINAYLWNKYWTFRKYEADGTLSLRAVGREYGKFLTVGVVGFLLNVGVALVIVNGIGPQFGWSDVAWANIGAAAGSAVAILWNFTGYKLFVFRDTMRP